MRFPALASLSGKMSMIALAPLGVVFLASWFGLVPVIEKAFLNSRREYLRHLSETAYGVLEAQEALAKEGVQTREEAQKRAVALIKQIRFGKTGYFYVFNREPRIVTVPIKPEMEGKLVGDFNDANGQLIYIELNKLGRNPEGGFLNLMFAKPGCKGCIPS